MNMKSLIEYYTDAFFAVIYTLVRDYASEIFQNVANDLGAYYTEDEIELLDDEDYLRLLRDAVDEFVGKNELGLITDLFVDEFENMCIDEDVCNDILSDKSITQSYLNYAVHRAKKSYNIDESSKCDLAFALLLSDVSFSGIPEYVCEDIEDNYDVIGEITNLL